MRLCAYLCLTAFTCTLLFLSPVQAEKAPMSKEELTKTATHVVVGKVQAIFTRSSKDGDWAYTNYVAEVVVQKTEKGDGLKAGDLVYARYWNRAWNSSKTQPPSTNGHWGLPKAGDVLRIYLARNAYDGFTTENKDGGYNVIGANGFEKM